MQAASVCCKEKKNSCMFFSERGKKTGRGVGSEFFSAFARSLNLCFEWDGKSRKGVSLFFLVSLTQELRGGFHKFCGGDICFFSTTQHRGHTQSSEVWVCCFLFCFFASVQNFEPSCGVLFALLSLRPPANHLVIESFVPRVECRTGSQNPTE